MFLTLDGVYEGQGSADEDRRGGFERGGWVAGRTDDEIWPYITSVYARADAFLLGRRTWQSWAAYRPHHDGGDRVSHGLNVLPPPGAQPPPLWGRERHVRDLLGDRVTDVQATVGNLTVDAFSGPEDFLAYFKRNYGPTIAVYKSLADQPERAAALDQELTDLAGRFGFADGATTIDWEYLHFTATRA